MPELWQLCNHESQVILTQLYYDEQGCRPDFFDILEGKKQAVTMSPEAEEDMLEETHREMAKTPSHQRRVT